MNRYSTLQGRIIRKVIVVPEHQIFIDYGGRALRIPAGVKIPAEQHDATHQGQYVLKDTIVIAKINVFPVEAFKFVQRLDFGRVKCQRFVPASFWKVVCENCGQYYEDHGGD